MNTFLHARYHEAHRRYLAQVAYMHETNLAFAEKKGGVAALEGADKNRFEGIQSRLIELVAFADAAQEYTQSLEDWIENLIIEKKRLAERLAEHTGEHPLPPPVPYREYLQMMVFGTRIPSKIGAFVSAKEGRRQATKTALALQMPHLF